MLKSKALLIACISLSCIVSLSYALSPAASTRQRIEAPPENTSQALEVISTARVEDRVKLALKNVSKKTITGYQLSIGESRVQIEFLDADEPSQQALAPEGVYEEWYKLSPNTADIKITILAVVFDDGKSEGDERFIKEIKDVRHGKRLQLARIIPLIRKAEVAQDMDTAAALEDLEIQITALPEFKDATLSGNVQLGLQNGREFILNKIRALKHTNRNRGLPQRTIVIGNLREHTERKLEALATQ